MLKNFRTIKNSYFLHRNFVPLQSVFSTKLKNSYFLHWNFDWKSCFVVFFLEWNEWKNPQFNFSSQNLSLERNFFKWDGKVTKIKHLLFHRIWKNSFLNEEIVDYKSKYIYRKLSKVCIPMHLDDLYLLHFPIILQPLLCVLVQLQKENYFLEEMI